MCGFSDLMTDSTCPETMSRSAWPELKGRPWKEASDYIRREYPKIMVQVVRGGKPTFSKERTDRVKIYVDSDGNVIETPTIG
ncbi:hypothetical protein BaRGS_00021770 [Batillaria attramentaria]|uniref:Uncharacterized protein n=1 Tax=Batillaria attramentaria TaxID=370345 RepID=A0ABD0KIT4_9CAEN